jgi:hypothetical protein
MRLAFIIFGFTLIAAGCNSDPRCRRETALLRAEILDLEDKYFVTKAQRDEALAALHGQGKTDVAAKIERRIRPDRIPRSSEIHYGEMIHDGQVYVDGEWHDESAYMDHYSFDGYELPIRSDHMAPVDPSRSLDPTSPTHPTPSSNPQFRESKPRDSILVPPADDVDRQSSPDSRPGRETSYRNGNSSYSASAGQSVRTSQLKNATSALSSAAITDVVIDRNFSGVNIAETGEGELALLLRTRNASGVPIHSRGSITTSIVDPHATSAQQRLGIWKFLPEETELFMVGDRGNAGILLNLPFENQLPQGNEIVVMVRFQSLEGKVLETTARIRTDSGVRNNPRPRSEQSQDDLVAERDVRSKGTGVDPQKSPAASANSGPAWRPVR